MSEISYEEFNIDDEVNILDTLEYSLMSVEIERKYGMDIKKGREELVIIKEDVNVLFPMIDIETILLSIRDNEDIDLLKEIKRLPYTLGNDNLLKIELPFIKKYLNICSSGIPSSEELKNNFKELSFDDKNKLKKEVYVDQMILLRKYLIAKTNFYNRNLKLVISIARKLSNIAKILTLDDCIQEGTIGLIKAINKYDVETGYKFSTYATYWIRQNINSSIIKYDSTIRKPAYLYDKYRKYEKFYNSFLSLNGVEPTTLECANALGMTVDEFIEIRCSFSKVISLSVPVYYGDEELELQSVIPSDDEYIEDLTLDKAMIDYILFLIDTRLSPRKKEVLLCRFGFNDKNYCYSLQEIADKLGVRSQRVSQIKDDGIENLRRVLKMGEMKKK